MADPDQAGQPDPEGPTSHAPAEGPEATGTGHVALVAAIPAERSGRRRSWPRRLLGLVVPAAVLSVWWAATRFGWVSSLVLPQPGDVLTSAHDFVIGPSVRQLPGTVAFNRAFVPDLVASLHRWALGAAVGVGVALPLGMALGLSRRAEDLLDPLFQGLRSVPIFAWLPLSVIWFGIGEGSARFLVFVAVSAPVAVATADAVRQVPRAWVESARMLGTPRRALAARVYVPAALPGIVTGLRLGLTLGWMTVIVAELTGASDGVGAMMAGARETGRLDQIMVGMVVFAVVGLYADIALRAVARPFVAWSRR